MERSQFAIQKEVHCNFLLPHRTKKTFNYPRNDDKNYYFDLDSKKFALGRYDLNGTPLSLESLWEKAGKQKSGAAIGARPTAKHDDPLNVFAERNVKDK